MTFVDECKYAGGNYQSQNQQQSCDENYEWIVVADTDTVVDPGAVMVKPFYTYVADSTVLATRCTDHFAVRTHLAWMNFAKQFHKRKFWL